MSMLACGGGGSGDAVNPPPASDWVIPTGSGTLFRAVHMGGNWGTNVESSRALPAGYFEYLRDLNVNWVGISVALHLDDSMDSSVERKATGVRIPTFADDVLAQMIRTFRRHGFNVYLTLAFELEEAALAAHPVRRWQLGDPNYPAEDPSVVSANWPWSPSHPDHASFVAEFWRSYTDQAVHFARLAQAEGVAMFSLGTETERLFRTRVSARWTTQFGDELRAMVAAVRAVYAGRVTYDMHYQGLTTRSYYDNLTDHLWQDLGLDVVGISAYFPLSSVAPTSVMSTAELETAWDAIFRDHLQPLKARNPGKPVLFLEYGYVDSVRAPYEPAAESFTTRAFADADGDGADDGQRTQANIHQALFATMSRHPGVLEGAFLWDTMMADAQTWAAGFATMREFSVRGKLAEPVVRSTYGTWRQ
ncbi:MAG: glycoside hydrolase TIM-barrel-like domain-containing protein [Ideonella sp.]|nr:glycoside hydrolase TIM-barrel-like domain-containing protein [Ideonella sp.]MCC7458475.1 glycoside hydrolase TIM-barrel-like domain-containing protein [Nitrospira sp.]